MKHLNPRQGITTRRRALSRGDHRRARETPKSPPGDYNVGLRSEPGQRLELMCETPKSPPGDYNGERDVDGHFLHGSSCACETPKSPPGDYNSVTGRTALRPIAILCVKHLNPRQGITTNDVCHCRTYAKTHLGVKHLNPRQGITTRIRRRR